ncbi:unnamed protein product [Litomosoides sigmodontis]|uniref:Peroxin-1 n=1 Tax=Litomosoides sigmodontis TaxID=42156 RepID=A0A3P6UHT5_LITSI|nr:unnamed protein product [Litomosoides sigmodontis]
MPSVLSLFFLKNWLVNGSTRLMGTYSAVLKYHQRRNCFGYIQQQYSDKARTTSIQVNATTSGAYNVIRCENPTDCGIIQVFAPNDHCCYRSKVLFINKIFADLFGLRENEEVIVQKVKTAPVCSSFEVELTSAEDWDVVQKSSQRIEEVLLEQIQLISVGQTYPVWIAQNLHIYFTVARIEAFSSLMQNACLCEFTEVHVRPYYPSPSSLEKNSSKDVLGILPTSFECRMKDLFSDLVPKPFVFRIEDYCGNVFNKTTVRVLPEILTNGVFLEELDILAVFKLNFSQRNSEIIAISTVCNSETGQTVNALLIELPIACSRFAALRDCLKGKLPDNFNESLRNRFWKTCRHYPIIVPADGLKVEVNLTDKARIQCRIRPHFDGKKYEESWKCFVFTNDMFPTLEYPNIELMKESFTQVKGANINETVANFGVRKNEAVKLSFQIAFIEKCYTYITYHLKKPTFPLSESLLIVGNKSAGKTTILHLLAEKLLHSHFAVYSECLYCSEWNGKSVEKFQDVLKAATMRLRRRYPSVLFLDNLDVLFYRQDEDVRNVRVEKCAELLRNLTTENDFLIVATARTKYEVVELFSLNTGERFFGHVEGITELSPIKTLLNNFTID